MVHSPLAGLQGREKERMGVSSRLPRARRGEVFAPLRLAPRGYRQTPLAGLDTAAAQSPARGARQARRHVAPLAGVLPKPQSPAQGRKETFIEP
jgi:hypothetical protein